MSQDVFYKMEDVSPDTVKEVFRWADENGLRTDVTMLDISKSLARIHFGEKLGTGFERISEICDKENAPFPEIEFNENYFYVTFGQSHEYLELAGEEEAKEELAAILNERQKKAMDYVKEKGRITNREYVKMNNVSRETAKRDLSDLVDKSLFKTVGKGRSLHYVIGS